MGVVISRNTFFILFWKGGIHCRTCGNNILFVERTKTPVK